VQSAFATHHDLAHVPAKVIELESDDLSGAKAEPRQEEQDREGASAARRRTIRCHEDSLDLLGREERRQRCGLPPTNRGHGRREIRRCRAIEEAEAKKRAQRRGQQLHDRDRARPTLAEKVAADRRCVEGQDGLREPLSNDECANERRVDLKRAGAKPSVVTEMIEVPLNEQLG